MEKRKKQRYIAFELHQKWGVLDRTNGELIEQADYLIERYPEAWARNRAYKLNKEDEAHETVHREGR